ncbi:hypothetical protein Clacol_003028 [Clathrus columnatus]|uniref:Uncharacterized protein n=1 Tax=Clathrus columnatus TaxID=1419009 RepID=A0AAV5A6D3_9AGAM|nr:hypothetical protein Clacol_003028 [Clathrus columnatus]
MNGRIPIKELVSLFESAEPEVVSPSQKPSPKHATSHRSGPPPSPARFIQHPLLKKTSYPAPSLPSVREPIPTSKQHPVAGVADKYNGLPSPSNPSLQSNTPSSSLERRSKDAVHTSNVSRSTLVNDSDRRDRPKLTTQRPVTTPRRSLNSNLKSPNSSSPDIPLVPIPSHGFTQVAKSEPSWPPSYVSSDWIRTPSSVTNSKFPNDTYMKDNYDVNVEPVSGSSPDDHHNPIAAKTVFSRGAAPLSLPALDKYLSKAPQPKFTPFFTPKSTNSKGKPSESNIFPPLDLLQASKKTLDDLEKNTTVPSFFRSRSAIFAALLNVFTGILPPRAL